VPKDHLRHYDRFAELAAVADGYTLFVVALARAVSEKAQALSACRAEKGDPPSPASLLAARVHDAYWGAASRAFVNGFRAASKILIPMCVLRPGESAGEEGEKNSPIAPRAMEKSFFWRVETPTLARRLVQDANFRPQLVIFDLRGEPARLRAVIVGHLLELVAATVEDLGLRDGGSVLGEVERHLVGTTLALDASEKPLAEVYVEHRGLLVG
jgi:hypothetical protein